MKFKLGFAWILATVGSGGSLSAQETLKIDNKLPPRAGSKATERMEVTGSRLKRIDVEGAIPVKVLESKDFERAGITTFSDIFRNQSESTFGNYNGTSGDISAGQATINLRGLGGGRTLILVDGRRLPADASLGGTNINNIPIAMVDRVEILKMSASAVYGADAVAGVINVILKKNVYGSEVSARASTTQDGGGEERRFDAVTGVQLGQTNLTLAIGASQHTPLYSRERDQLWKTRYPYNTSAYTNPAGTFSWGLLNPDKPSDTNGLYAYHPSENCPQENQIAYPDDPENVMCRGSRRAGSTGQETRATDTWFVTTHAESEWTSHLRSSLTVLLADRQGSSERVNRFGTTDPVDSGDYTLLFKDAPADIRNQATRLGLTAAEGSQIKIASGNLSPEVLGSTASRDQARGAILGINGDLRGGWEWHLDMSGFQTERRRYYNNVDDKLTLKESVFPNDGGTPKFNLFNPDGSQLDSFFTNLYGREVNGIAGATTYVNGDLVTLPAGTASIAMGLNFQRETYELIADEKDKEFVGDKPRYWGSMNADGRGQREIVSAFVETNVPVAERLEWGLAGRFDQYSDFGGTFNYGTSVTYAPTSILKLRGSYGTSFKAPDLSLLFNASDGGYRSVRDEKYCDVSLGKDNPCGERSTSYSTYVNSPGNPDLKEESARSFNIGFVLEPTEFFSATTDYWSVVIDGVQRSESLNLLIEREIRGESTGQSKIVRVTDAGADNLGRIARIDSTYSNLGQLRSQGVDIGTSFHTSAAGARWSFDTNYSNVISRKEKQTNEGPMEELVGAYSVPRYRVSNHLGWSTNAHSVGFDAQTTGRVENSKFDTDPSYGYIAAWTRYDANYSWSHPWQGSVSLGVANIENKIHTVHLVNRETGAVAYDSTLSDIAGRSYYVSAKQRF